ncbi:hypothetical protein D8682_05880 [Buttiauxella sp. 3AFRM03]|uniref:hypothetical protein n=1 Tax=Buttiauxella sp. 3AFRM03 TaxID=2479367 RepID=UPI000EF7B830|nr:hypothetical protein [Buttiauxella sp. 3AFRM03]AYN26561.1 hypothetical protein D8682_05880 [Buttiauxella sp. 3AFRM03]
MSKKIVNIYIPAELEYIEHNHHACLRFHYRLPATQKLPQAGDLFTALTLEQAKETVTFLQQYIEKTEVLISASSAVKH